MKAHKLKKRGSILIEAMAGIFILSLASALTMNTLFQSTNILKKRILCEKANCLIYNLINEIQYNVSQEKVEELLDNNSMNFKYSDDLDVKLLSSEIKDLERGEDINIVNVGECEVGLKLRIIVNIKKDNMEIKISKDFIKSWWMDEV